MSSGLGLEFSRGVKRCWTGPEDFVDREEAGTLAEERRTRADQKLVSFIVLPCGRSRIKLPRSSCVQSPRTRASVVHTYVFCEVILMQVDT